MHNSQSGLVDVGSAPFVPHVSRSDDGRSSVSLLRRLPAGSHVAVWTHHCPPRAAKALCAWMWKMPEQWPVWGRIALRLGDEVVEPLILDGAAAAEREDKERERKARQEEKERRRLEREITLYVYDPKSKGPSLGLQRGCDDRAFWRMSFTEKWERDRVVDWLRWQKEEFNEFDTFFREHGALELERLVLAGMRQAERTAKEKGVSSSGRRPLRFWRGER